MGGAAALDMNDMAFTQYREPGLLMWRDFGIQVVLLSEHCNVEPWYVGDKHRLRFWG